MGASGLASNISCFGKMEISCSLISGRFLSVGPDGIRQERPHLLVVLKALNAMQVHVLAVRPVSPSHGFIYLRNLSAFHSFLVVVLCYVGSWLT